MKQIIIDGIAYNAKKIKPTETSGKNCVFYENAWYELVIENSVENTIKKMQSFQTALRKQLFPNSDNNDK